MAASYGEVPQGGLLHIPPAIPTGLLYRVKQISGVSKQLVKMVPLSGNTSAGPGQKVIVSLPSNCLVDLATFEFNFVGTTQHAGNGGSSQVNNYVQKRYFPRNSASLIENLEIKINGQSRQNINQYGYLYNILNDYLCGQDSNFKNKIGCNADPSNKHHYANSSIRRCAGYPIGINTDTVADTYHDRTEMSIRNWLGFLGGNTSTTIIDTSLYGDITIEITLAPDSCLMLGGTVPTSITSVNNASSETGIAIASNAGTALINSEGTGYSITNIGFQIVRYDMPGSYYSAVASLLESGSVFKLYYPNYVTFTSTAQALPKGGTTRFMVSTQSLDMVISTFQTSDRTTQQYPILGDLSNNYVSIDNEWGSYKKSFDYARLLGVQKLLNNSKYFLRNGDGIQYGTYLVGAVRLVPESILEQFNGVLRAFNCQQDTLGGLYPGIASLYHYQSQFYSHILSLNVSSEHDMYTVSGLNCSATPIMIGWEITGLPSANVGNIDSGASGNILGSSTSCTPIQFACMTSHLEVSAGRNIITIL